MRKIANIKSLFVFILDLKVNNYKKVLQEDI